jgi:hypothetical protein
MSTPNRSFSWIPRWVMVLILVSPIIYLIVAVVLRKTMAVQTPLCGEHRNYWRSRDLFVYGGFGFSFLVAVAYIVAAITLPAGLPGGYVPWMILGGAVFGWLVSAVFIQGTSIGVGEITDERIVLIRCHQDFVDALRSQRRGLTPKS